MIPSFIARAVAGRVPTRPAFSGCESLEPRRLFAAGALDTSFGGDGDVSTSVPGTSLTGRDVAVQADGKTVVVGHAGFSDRVVLTRYNLDGTPDTTFGLDHNGTILTQFTRARAECVAIQPDGKIVVVASHLSSDTYVMRFTPNGALDRNFGPSLGGGGFVSFGPVEGAHSTEFRDVIVLPDGKILLGGFSVYADGDFDFTFVRLGPSGGFDSTFDGDGKMTLDMGGSEVFEDMAIDYSGTPATNPGYGSIIVVGPGAAPNGLLKVIRLTPDGALPLVRESIVRVPSSFGGSIRPAAVVVQDDGRIVVGGSVEFSAYFLVRLDRDGLIDPSFGAAQTGWVETPVGGASTYDLLQAPSGGLILGGSTRVNGVSRDAIAYYTADGRPDTRFGGTGTMTYGFTGGVALAAGPGRRFVFAGGPGMHAARFLDAGANVVYAATLNPVASEAGPTSRGFFLYRTERVPFATRVYFTVGGTAFAPTGRALRDGFHDYVTEGLVFPVPGGPTVPYAEIPANETFTVVTMTPRQDRESEGNETATFTIRPDANYEVGDPGDVTLIIADDDAPPPTVTQVWVRGSSWKGTDGDALNVTFKEYLGANGLGHDEFGYRVDNLPAGTTLPWTNVNEVVLRYSSPPTGSGIPVPGGVTLDGVRSDYAATSVQQIDPQTFVVRLDRALGAPGSAGGVAGDRVALRVAGGGPNGTAYALTLNTLQGDADRAGGRVTAFDISAARARSNRTSTQPPPPAGAAYTPFADVNTDGRINVLDLAAIRGRLRLALPATTASVAVTALSGALRLSPDRRERHDDSSAATSVLD